MTHRHLDALDAEPPTMEQLAVPQSRSVSGYAFDVRAVIVTGVERASARPAARPIHQRWSRR